MNGASRSKWSCESQEWSQALVPFESHKQRRRWPGKVIRPLLHKKCGRKQGKWAFNTLVTAHLLYSSLLTTTLRRWNFGPTVFNVQSLRGFLIELGNIKRVCTFCSLCSKWCAKELRMRTAVAATRSSAPALQLLESFSPNTKSVLMVEKKGKHVKHFLWSCIPARGIER